MFFRQEDLIFILGGNENFCKGIMEEIFGVCINRFESRYFCDGQYGFGLQCFVNSDSFMEPVVINIFNRLNVQEKVLDEDIIGTRSYFLEAQKCYNVFLFNTEALDFLAPVYLLDEIEDENCRIIVNMKSLTNFNEIGERVYS